MMRRVHNLKPHYKFSKILLNGSHISDKWNILNVLNRKQMQIRGSKDFLAANEPLDSFFYFFFLHLFLENEFFSKILPNSSHIRDKWNILEIYLIYIFNRCKCK